MNYRKLIGVASTSLFLMIVLTKYQNCAPAVGPESSTGTDEVRVVDDWLNKKVAFAEIDVTAQDSRQEVVFHGLCARANQGQALNWKLENVAAGELIDQGESSCERGGFEILAGNLQNMACGEDHRMTAFAGEDEGVLTLRRKCAPEQMKIVVEDSVRNESCALELNVSDSSDSACNYSCYRDGKLVNLIDLDLDQCSELTAAR